MSEYEYAVKWDGLGAAWPEAVHPKESQAAAERALFTSAFDGVVVRRRVTEWEEFK